MPSECICIRSFVCVSFTQCTIMYCEQTSGLRSARFCPHMHVANFYPNPRLEIDLQFQGQIFESKILENTYVKTVVFIDTAKTTRTDYTNRDDVKGVSGYVKECF